MRAPARRSRPRKRTTTKPRSGRPELTRCARMRESPPPLVSGGLRLARRSSRYSTSAISRSASVSGLSDITCNRTTSAPYLPAMSQARSSAFSLCSEPSRATRIRSMHPSAAGSCNPSPHASPRLNPSTLTWIKPARSSRPMLTASAALRGHRCSDAPFMDSTADCRSDTRYLCSCPKRRSFRTARCAERLSCGCQFFRADLALPEDLAW
jgi:hypothetical protein